MRRLLATASLVLLALYLVSSAPRTASADTALGTSTWSLELGTNVGAGNSEYYSLALRHGSDVLEERNPNRVRRHGYFDHEH